MAHHIDGWITRLLRQVQQTEEAANVMSAPVAWAEVNDLNPVTTWAEGRQETIKHLRETARLANEIADYAATLPAYTLSAEQ